ncbi:MAG TPA: HupE/UreJ family protein [Cyclobacteriaceae bacterium]|jgi:hypothetical protein
MSEFGLYFQLGVEHILDTRGYDHILFIIALCVIYNAREWSRVLILVTAFTIGHSITLVLATLELISVRTDVVEFLIPVTILITATNNIFSKPSSGTRRIQVNYLFALFFGLIHGLGFSNYLKSLLGTDSSVITQLFAFNIGIEAGQIIIVGIYMIVAFIANGIFYISRRDWVMVISSAIAGIAFILIIENKFW